ncbi:MAG: riboflavin synthase [Bacteriovoracaceae bacterium]
MFTGLVKELGKVISVTPNKEGTEITISSNELIKEIGVDDSVAVNGCCQTVIRFDSKSFTVQAVQVTLDKTTFGGLKPGDEVNLELALRLSDRLGGHLVQGHVNGVGQLRSIQKNGKNYVLSIGAPEALSKYIVKEGSIAIEGISLTVADKNLNEFKVSIIPHTWENTILKNRKVGDSLNLEIDILAKYVESILGGQKSRDDFSMEWIKSKGF